MARQLRQWTTGTLTLFKSTGPQGHKLKKSYLWNPKTFHNVSQQLRDQQMCCILMAFRDEELNCPELSWTCFHATSAQFTASNRKHAMSIIKHSQFGCITLVQSVLLSAACDWCVIHPSSPHHLFSSLNHLANVAKLLHFLSFHLNKWHDWRDDKTIMP